MALKPALSQRAATGKPSMTLLITAKAKKLKAEGKDVISFAAGEPDFKTPPHICEAAKRAIDEGLHGYTPNAGLPALREAVCARFRQDIGVSYTPEEVLVSSGAKYSLFLAIQAMIDPGDEVILPAPYWVSYPEMITLAGGVPVILETKEKDGFLFSASEVERLITPKTKLLILNSPSNPSGAVLPPSLIEELGHLLVKKGIYCLSDEIYDKMIYGDTMHKSIASIAPQARAQTVVVNGCSKTYAMTGWRIGYAAGPKEIINAMDNLQSQSTSNACSIAQAAAIAALTGPQECVKTMVQEFALRRDLIVRLLNEIPGVRCSTPGGAFYVLPDIAPLLGKAKNGKKIENPSDFCAAALDHVLIAMVPGESFGAPTCIRLSYAVSRAQIEEGCRRLKAFVEGLEG